MEQITATPYTGYPGVHHEAHSSGVCWSAVIAGAFAAASLALILLALGAGLGLSSVSPWSNVGASANTIGKSAILWLIVTEALSAAMGGYIAGRLRKRWATIHLDEVHFRDTAHGFLAWSVALVITVAFLTTAATYMVGSSQPTADTSARSGGQSSDPNGYFVDALFRADPADVSKSVAADATTRNEAAIIFARGLSQGALSSEDKTYLDQLVSAKTGMSVGTADSRISNDFAAAQQSIDAIRKATAHSLLWIFLALLIGAFSASLLATVGGRQRDRVVVL